MLIPSVTNPAYSQMIDGAERAASAADYLILLASTGEGDPEIELQLQRLSQRVDGVIFASARKNSHVLDRLDSYDVPVMLLNRAAGPRFHSVIGDDELGVSLAIRHIVELGHRRIAHIAGPSTIDTAERRRKAFVAVCKELGVPQADNNVVRGELSVEFGVHATEEFMGRGVRSKPTAIFCGSLALACRLLPRSSSSRRIPLQPSARCI